MAVWKWTTSEWLEWLRTISQLESFTECGKISSQTGKNSNLPISNLMTVGYGENYPSIWYAACVRVCAASNLSFLLGCLSSQKAKEVMCILKKDWQRKGKNCYSTINWSWFEFTDSYFTSLLNVVSLIQRTKYRYYSNIIIIFSIFWNWGSCVLHPQCRHKFEF